jgi:phosphatidylserine decarboxylase
MLKQYDADESGLLDKVELTTMLDTLGSTLHEATIDSFFERFAYRHNGEHLLTFDEAVVCLEDQLEATEAKNAKRDGSFASGSQTPMTSGMLTPINQSSSTTSIPVLETNTLGKEGEEGADIQIDDLADDKGEEHVIEIRECPICHQPKLNKRSDANIITKISYGGYKLGANSANILVQDRLTGQINEERMSVYVRLGIRLLYKGLKANNMEKKRSRLHVLAWSHKC